MNPSRRGLLLASLTLGGAAAPVLPSEPMELTVGRAFTIAVPQGSSLRQGPGDSTAGLIEGPGLILAFDYGVYADPLTADPNRRFTRQEPVVVDGRIGTLFVWPDPKRSGDSRLGLHIPIVTQTPLGPTRLTLVSDLAAPDDEARIRSMIATIHFQRQS